MLNKPTHPFSPSDGNAECSSVPCRCVAVPATAGLGFFPLPRSPQVPEALDPQEEPALPDLGEGSHRAPGAAAVRALRGGVPAQEGI